MPRRIFTTALTLTFLCASASSADVLLTKRRDADEFFFQSRMSPGAKNQKVEIWIGPDRVRRDDGTTALILRLDQRKLYLVNHSEKTYTATDLRKQGDHWTATATHSAPPEAAAVWRYHAKVEATNETRQVGSWKASRYRIGLSNQAGTAERIRLDWWIAPELKVEDAPLQTLLRLQASFGIEGDEWIATALALPGYPVLYERVEQLPEAEVKIREELVAVKEGEAPEQTYEVPSGYRLLDLGEYRDLYGWPSPL